MNRHAIAAIVFLLAHVAPFPATAGVAPVHSRLKRAESDHFVYIFQDSLIDRMPEFMRICEDAHAVLTPVFKWTPRARTTVMYVDAEDVHNGWATVYPRPTILVHASDAPPGTTIYEPGNYVRRTVFHEYAHVLTMDAQHGTDAVLSRIFGRVLPIMGDPLSILLMLLSAPPGVLAPRWYQEGLAIWSETEFVGPGRGRSSRVDMMFRTEVAEDRLLGGRDWTLDLPEWPYGAATYLYGMKVIQHIHDEYGFGDQERNVPGEVAYGISRSFLYNFSNRSVPATGQPMNRLAAAALRSERERQARRIAVLSEIPFTPIQRLTPKRLIATSPRFGPDGKTVYFAGRMDRGRDSLYCYDRRRQRAGRLGAARTISSALSDIAPGPGRQSMYYTRLNVSGRDRVRSEICRLPVGRRRARCVTRKGRYRYPAISPDGRRLAAIVNRAGLQSLVHVPLSAAGRADAERTLVAAPPGQTLVDPVYHPSGRSIVFVQADENGSRLSRVDIDTTVTEVLADWPCIALSPAFHPSGRELVFSADRNGVHNLFRLQLREGARPEPLTHVLGGVFEPDFSPDGSEIVVSAYDSHGYFLAVLPYTSMEPLAAPLPALEPGWKTLPSNRAVVEQVISRPQPTTGSVGRYNSLFRVRPDFWFPWFTLGPDTIGAGLGTSLSDPADFHALQLVGGMSGEGTFPLGAAVYQYSGAYPILTLYGAFAPQHYIDLVKDEFGVYYDYGEAVGTAGASIGIPLPRADWQASLTIGYQFSDRDVIDDAADDYAGRTITPSNLFEGVESALWGQLDFFNATAFHRSHSLEDGRHVSLGISWSDEDALGSDLSQTRFRADWQEYIDMPWPPGNHVLKLDAAYAVGTGDETGQGLFGVGQDVSALADVPGVGRNIPLRGYSPNYQVGTEAARAGIAYRFPIVRSYKSINTTLPLYFHQLFAEVFYEGAVATGSEPSGRKNKWLNAAGLELNFATTLFRLVALAPGIGVVYAADFEEHNRDGGNDYPGKLQIYISAKGVVNF